MADEKGRTVDEIITEQQTIDERRRDQVDEIIDGLGLDDLGKAIRSAKAWCSTALQAQVNAEYWRDRSSVRNVITYEDDHAFRAQIREGDTVTARTTEGEIVGRVMSRDTTLALVRTDEGISVALTLADIYSVTRK